MHVNFRDIRPRDETKSGSSKGDVLLDLRSFRFTRPNEVSNNFQTNMATTKEYASVINWGLACYRSSEAVNVKGNLNASKFVEHS